MASGFRERSSLFVKTLFRIKFAPGTLVGVQGRFLCLAPAVSSVPLSAHLVSHSTFLGQKSKTKTPSIKTNPPPRPSQYMIGSLFAYRVWHPGSFLVVWAQ